MLKIREFDTSVVAGHFAVCYLFSGIRLHSKSYNALVLEQFFHVSRVIKQIYDI